MTTVDALHRSILADPDNDTLRLAYADALDERGRGDDAARAELIRVQIRAEKLTRVPVSPRCGSVSDRWCPACGDSTCRDPERGLSDPGCPLHDEDSPHAGTADRILSLHGTAARLIAAHPEWSWLKCPSCGGDGRRPPEAARRLGPDCGTCYGTGDLFVIRRPGDGTKVTSRNPVFRRGFIESVECRLDEVWQEREVAVASMDNAFSWIIGPTSWARALIEAVPTLTRFVITDREPARGSDGTAEWYKDRGRNLGGYFLPGVLFDALTGRAIVASVSQSTGDPVGVLKAHPTPAAARDDLAVAVCDVVRKAVAA
ncbi:TIGR02996 domain-containing protein [Gemmata sp.]|uniref:TIGR02996 domain-containing protein n=1 Tax=Gemmata sp. TaxID=1914242 RepID=UPI003F6ED134